MAKTGNIEEKEKRRPSRVLMFFHIFFLLISIIYIQWIWEPNQKFIRHFQPSKQMEIIEPRRGSIIDTTESFWPYRLRYITYTWTATSRRRRMTATRRAV